MNKNSRISKDFDKSVKILSNPRIKPILEILPDIPNNEKHKIAEIFNKYQEDKVLQNPFHKKKS
jgi:hypothetical protein